MSRLGGSKASILTVVFLLAHLVDPGWLQAGTEKSLPSPQSFATLFKERFFRNWARSDDKPTPEEMEKIIESSDTVTFGGDPRLRAEQASIIRPVKQIALEVLDGEVGIIQSFLSYQAAKFLGDTLTSSSAGGILAKARRVVGMMSPGELKSFNGALDRLDVSKSISSMASQISPGLKNLLRSETKFAAMGVIGALISMGIYDGLDLSTVKDRVLALDPMTTNATVKQGLLPGLLAASASRHFDTFFAKRFDLFYDKMITSSSFGKTVLKKIELKADSIGSKIFRAGRVTGIPPKGDSLAKKLGLVGVGEGTRFALKDFLRTVSTGVAFGLVANIVIDTVSEGVMGYNNAALIGANRNKKSVRPEFNTYLFQKTGNSLKDAINERKFVLKDLFDHYGRHPITEFVSTVSGFTGAYLGSVVAGAVLIGGGLPTMVGGVMVASLFGGIGSYLGYWATNKFERSDSVRGFRRTYVENRLRKVIKKMSITSRENWEDVKISQLAKDRALDMDKLEARGQAYSRIFLVEALGAIDLYSKGDFINMRNSSERGESFDTQAHIRYDFIDINGNQGNWDMVQNEVFDVGNVQKNNGARVIFITDDDNVKIEDGLLKSEQNTDFRVLSNGLVMAKSDYAKKDWVIKGQNVNTDIFLRNSKLRFTWDEKLNSYAQVITSDRSQDSDPLKALLSSFPSTEETSGMEKLLKRIQFMMEISSKQAVEKLENLDPQDEDEYLLELQKIGASDLVINKFNNMEFEEWKNLLSGKIRRGLEQRYNSLVGSLSGESLKDLQSSLSAEIMSPESVTIWDEFRNILDPRILPLEFIR